MKVIRVDTTKYSIIASHMSNSRYFSVLERTCKEIYLVQIVRDFKSRGKQLMQSLCP